jgi:SMI1 / KNR4 family (SUKH-1)
MTAEIVAELRRRAADPHLATDEAARFPSTAAAPLDDGSIARAEAILGRRLPVLLRDAYRLVGDGGFGPGYGIVRLLPDPESSDVESVVGLYTAFCSRDPEDPAWSWPAQLVPFCDWGCAIRSCVDCSTQDGAVVTFDPNVRDLGGPMSNAFAVTHPRIDSWFADWLAGVKLWDRMFEPDPTRTTTLINPVTKEPVMFVASRLRRGGLT